MVSRHRTEGRDNGLKCGTVGTVELTSGIATVLRVYFGYPGNEFHRSNRSNLADAPPIAGPPGSSFLVTTYTAPCVKVFLFSVTQHFFLIDQNNDRNRKRAAGIDSE